MSTSLDKWFEPDTLLKVACIVVGATLWMTAGQNRSDNTAAAVADIGRHLDRIDAKLEGLPDQQARLAGVEIRLKEAQGFIGLLDGRQNVTERQMATNIADVANLKVSPRR